MKKIKPSIKSIRFKLRVNGNFVNTVMKLKRKLQYLSRNTMPTGSNSPFTTCSWKWWQHASQKCPQSTGQKPQRRLEFSSIALWGKTQISRTRKCSTKSRHFLAPEKQPVLLRKQLAFRAKKLFLIYFFVFELARLLINYKMQKINRYTQTCSPVSEEVQASQQ